MKNLFIRLIRVALGLLGVSVVGSCSAFMTTEEYGCPYADFEAKGVVTDEDGNGIRGVRVVISAEYPNTGLPPLTDTLWSNSNGEYGTEQPYMNWEFAYKDSVKLEFEDVDGQENGGEFQKVTIEVPVFKVKDGDGHWYSGAYEAGADVTMSKE